MGMILLLHATLGSICGVFSYALHFKSLLGEYDQGTDKLNGLNLLVKIW